MAFIALCNECHAGLFYYKKIANDIFKEENPKKIKDGDFCYSVYILNENKCESFRFLFICSIYEGVININNGIKNSSEISDILNEINTTENNILLYDFIDVLIKKQNRCNEKRVFKNKHIEIRQGVSSLYKYKYYSIKIESKNGDNYVIDFTEEYILELYKYFKEIDIKHALLLPNNEIELEKLDSSIFFIWSSLYSEINCHVYRKGIFYDSHFLEGKTFVM